jgi:transposase
MAPPGPHSVVFRLFFRLRGLSVRTWIRLLLDNHSARISKETQGWLSLHPNRFEFVFTPKHGSWLDIVETMFSKMARSMLRGIRVASKQELIDRIHLYSQHIDEDPVIFRWKY